jgi:ubiquinone/menaquinone biosynthesis C-methylase UbiE
MSDSTVSRDTIHAYWQERAQQNAGSATATTDDVYLRELEATTLVDAIRRLGLPAPIQVVDVGCGDGFSTLMVAEALPELDVLGLDYADAMVASAAVRLAGAPALRERVRFAVGDVTDLDPALGETTFDLAITDRCLINLESAERQAHAIAEIARHVRPGGYYLAIENFAQGQRNLNEARRSVGLTEIPVRWHNLFFDEAAFGQLVSPHFELVALDRFSSAYYYATRVVYSAMCQLDQSKPDYQHPIHRIGVKLPPVGDYSPIKLAILRRL